MRQHATSVSKAQKDIQRLKQEIAALESDLVATGSTKTADDVRRELDQVKDELCICLFCFCIVLVSDLRYRKASDREKDNLVRDRESKNSTLRQLGDELHKKELEESECRNQLRDKDELERRIEEMRTEIATAQVRLKVWVLGRSAG